jgi:hypothetical protein
MPPGPWTVRAGDATEPQEARWIVTDAAGDAYVVGHFTGTIDFGGGPLVSAGARDMFVARFNPWGELVWARRFGDEANQFGMGIALDEAGDVVVTGYFGGTIDFGGGPLVNPEATIWDLFVAKLDADDGAHIWSRRFGDASGNQEAATVDVDPSGRIVVCGHYSGTPDFGGGPLPPAIGRRILLMQLGPDGSHRWSRGWGAMNGTARCGAADANATAIVVAGTFDTEIDVGPTPTLTAGGRDGFLAMLDRDGTVMWWRTFGDASHQQGRRVAFMPDGDFVLMTYFQGSLDVGCGTRTSTGGDDAIVARFRADGTCRWIRLYGGSGNQYPDSLAVTPGGDILFGGRFDGMTRVGTMDLASAGLRDHWITRLTGDGTLVWTASYGDAEQQDQLYVAPGPRNRVYAAGSFKGTVDFGSGPITSAGGDDIFVTAIDR